MLQIIKDVIEFIVFLHKSYKINILKIIQTCKKYLREGAMSGNIDPSCQQNLILKI